MADQNGPECLDLGGFEIVPSSSSEMPLSFAPTNDKQALPIPKKRRHEETKWQKIKPADPRFSKILAYIRYLLFSTRAWRYCHRCQNLHFLRSDSENDSSVNNRSMNNQLTDSQLVNNDTSKSKKTTKFANCQLCNVMHNYTPRTQNNVPSICMEQSDIKAGLPAIRKCIKISRSSLEASQLCLDMIEKHGTSLEFLCPGSLERCDEIEKAAFYFGSLSRLEAERLLIINLPSISNISSNESWAPTKCFLVRYSDCRHYVLSFIIAGAAIDHVLLCYENKTLQVCRTWNCEYKQRPLISGSFDEVLTALAPLYDWKYIIGGKLHPDKYGMISPDVFHSSSADRQ